MQVDVVEAAYAELRTKLGIVRDFVSLQRAHQEYLSTLRAKFYIDNLEISQVRTRWDSFLSLEEVCTVTAVVRTFAR